jgi:hypothetical protein
MNFADYNAFRQAVQQLIEGDDAATTNFSMDTLDLIIGLGESRVYQGDEKTPGLRASSMVAALSQTVTSNACALPSDLLELKEVYFSGHAPLEIIPLHELRKYEADGQDGSISRYAAQDGDTLRFWPDGSGTVIGHYYKRPADLKTVTWGNAATFARYPELFIFASLVESAPFLGFDARMPMWDGMYRAKASGAQASEQMRVYGGSPLRIKAR